MSPTAIEWSDETWNPTVGCSRVSPGCDHCYAIRVASREMQPAHVGLTTPKESGRLVDWTGEVRLLPERLDTPLRWRKPRRVFVDSMSDLFHPDVPLDFLADVWDVMVKTRQHTYQVLTKRPQRMARALGPDGIGFYAAERPVPCPQPNIWLGTSVETQRYADLRIPHLLATPAAVRFLSCEPLLGPIELGPLGYQCDLPEAQRIGWVIVGGESGPKARPMDPEWVRSLRDQCVEAGVPFLFKQWGGRTAKANGRSLDGRTWDEYPR